MRWILLGIILPVIFSSNCKRQHRFFQEENSKLHFEIKTLQKSAGDCQTPSSPCARLDLIYPWFRHGNPALVENANRYILQVLIQNLSFEDYQGPITEEQLQMMADSFLLEYQQDSAAATESWDLSVNGEVTFQTSKIVVINLGTHSYTGGAHPNSYLSIFNFDIASGKLLRWEDIITDMDALKQLAEKHFRKARELPQDVPLSDQGFFWGDQFNLPQFFEIQEDGIYFWYNPYEIASYADGATDFTITYKELGRLVNKNKLF